MHPGLGGTGDGDQAGERIEGAHIQIARAQHQDGGRVAGGQRFLQNFCGDAEFGIGFQRHQGLCPQPQEAQRAGDAGMVMFGGKDADRRRARKAVALHIPAALPQHRMARRRQTSEMRHLAAGGEGEGSVGRQTQNLFHPCAGDFLHHGGGGSAGIKYGIVVPGGDEPIRRQRRRQSAAYHPGEEPPAART